MLNELKLAINAFIAISENDCNNLISAFKLKTLKKNDDLFKSINQVDSIVFLETGMLKKFINTNNGNELICCFYNPSQFYPVISKNLNNNYFTEIIRSVGDSKAHVISISDLEKFNNKNNGAISLLRKVIEQDAIQMEDRISNLMKTTADERYNSFLKTYPDVVSSINLTQFASYLGISPQHLSRLIKKNKTVAFS